MEALEPHTQLTTHLGIGVVVFLICAAGASLIWAEQYRGRMAPYVTVGSVDVSGLDPQTARTLVQTKIDALLTNGMTVAIDGEIKPLPLSHVISGDVVEDVNFDLDAAITEATHARRSPWRVMDAGLLLTHIWHRQQIVLPVSLSENSIKQEIYQQFPQTETLARDAGFIFTQTPTGWEGTIRPSINGKEFQWNEFFPDLNKALEQLTPSQVELNLVAKAAEVTNERAEALHEQALFLLSQPPFIFTDTDERGEQHTWTLDDHALSLMLSPTAQDDITADRDAFEIFLAPIATATEQAAQNARFSVNQGRVVEFAQSHDGRKLDRDVLFTTFTQALISNTRNPISLPFIIEEAHTKTADVNDLGIDQILGVGTSSYRGSPANRKKNIQNGVNLLNGLLIAPGETFSLLDVLKPFDTDNGYLPELVIKGNKITPELGGGLCQIGTTTFRAALNSGLPIVERSNHSLVVSYYNDPANHNPGTDATIYDPSPDLKFLNDTGHAILFQAENLTQTQELRFTFWGTSDGRKGSYEPPTVLRWIPVGDPQRTETTDLKPGEEKCQDAHIGADASFVYTIKRPDGTEEKTTFTSHYRPLPRMCLVGVETLSEPPPLDQTNLSTE
ncbi:VanW family protein [Candidatus Uhrbacteria bacterium]|nr:VanW family protein [Candidatus Uhrbacteria bacterium]